MLDTLLEKNLLPDWLIRIGIRRLLAQRLREERARYDRAAYIADLKQRPLAEQTKAANDQHYEVPTRFYQYCLGKRLKYSGCLYPTGRETLDEAEELMLALYVERARIADGQEILELGCGWGSLSLYLAEKFPGARITGVSNSATQREHIEAEARRRGLSNLRILTRDMNSLELEPTRFDRVVSVEANDPKHPEYGKIPLIFARDSASSMLMRPITAKRSGQRCAAARQRSLRSLSHDGGTRMARCTPVSPTKRWWASSVSMKRVVRASGSKPDSASAHNWNLPSRSVK